MPPLPSLPNVLKIAIKGTVGTQNWLNIFHALWSGSTPSVGNLTTYIETLSTAWEANFTPLQDNDTVQTSIEVTDLTSPLSAQVDIPNPITGTGEGDLLPASACCLVTYPTTYRYRGGHPRTYFSVGMQGDLNSAQAWKPELTDAVAAAWTAFSAAAFAGTFSGLDVGEQCAVSYINAHAIRITPMIIPLLPGEFNVEPRLAQQRRRLGRK